MSEAKQSEKRVERFGRGPMNLHIEVAAGCIDVVASDTETAEVTLAPVLRGDAVALDLISRAVIEERDKRFQIVVPSPKAATNRSRNIGSDPVFGMSISFEGIHVHAGEVRIGETKSFSSVGQVRLKITVPAGSRVLGKTLSAAMDVYADDTTRPAEVSFASTSGCLSVDGSRRVSAQTISGAIAVDNAEQIHVSSTSGRICVGELVGMVNAQTVASDIHVHAKGTSAVSANSTSGDIVVTRDPGVNVSVDARTTSGWVRVR